MHSVTNHRLNGVKLICISCKSIKVNLKTIGHLQTLLKLIKITLFQQRNYVKLVWYCDELRMNKFEVKETRIEFLINNSRM